MAENSMQNDNGFVRRDFDLLEMLMNLLHRWYIVVGATVLAAILGAAYFYNPFFTPDVYSSSTLIYIGNRTEDDDTISTSGLGLSSALLGDYQELIQSRRVSTRVCEMLGLPSLSGYSVSVSSIKETRFIRVSVSGPYPESVAYIANAIAEVFSDVVVDLMDIRNVSVIDEALVPGGPSGPPRLRNTMVAAAAGFAVSLLVLIIIELANNTIKTPEDIENQLGIPVLALVSRVDADKK